MLLYLFLLYMYHISHHHHLQECHDVSVCLWRMLYNFYDELQNCGWWWDVPTGGQHGMCQRWNIPAITRQKISPQRHQRYFTSLTNRKKKSFLLALNPLLIDFICWRFFITFNHKKRCVHTYETSHLNPLFQQKAKRCLKLTLENHRERHIWQQKGGGKMNFHVLA